MKKVRTVLMKRVLASVLSFAMIVATVPMSVLAEGAIVSTAAETVEVTDVVENTEIVEETESAGVTEETEIADETESADVTEETESVEATEESEADEDTETVEVFVEISEKLLAEVSEEVENTGTDAEVTTPVYGSVLSDVTAVITDNGTDHTTVTVETANLSWHDAENGREAGWGIKFVVSRETDVFNGTYQVTGNYLAEGSDGIIESTETVLWMPVSPEYLRTAIENSNNLQMQVVFSWETEGLSQIIDFIIVPSHSIVLMDGATQVYPELHDITVEHDNTLGRVVLNNSLVDWLTVEECSDVNVEVTANEGYVIEEVEIDGLKQALPLGATTYNTVLEDVNESVNIKVAYAKLYEVTYTKTGNGSLDIEPSVLKENKLYLVEGTQVTITGNPDVGHYIESVSWNDVSEELTDVSAYSKTIDSVSEEYTIEICFVPYMYNFTVAPSEHGTVMLPLGQVAYGSNIQIELRPDDGYTVDYLKANGNDVVVSKNTFGAYIAEFLNVTQDFELTAGFKEIAYAEAPYFVIDTSKVLKRSADESLYVIGKDGCVTFSTNQMGIILQTSDGEYLGGWSTPEVSVSEACTITDILVCYKHPDEWFPELHKVEVGHKEIVVDRDAANATLDILTQAIDGVYNEPVTVAYKVSEPLSVSQWQGGIGSIKYSVLNVDDVHDIIAEGVLYAFDENTSNSVANEVASGENNVQHIQVEPQRSDVKVVLAVTDRAGNESTAESPVIKFCTEPPVVDVSIGGEKRGGEDSNYYFTTRELVITVTDSKNGYKDEESLLNGLMIKKDNQPLSAGQISRNVQFTHDENTHIITYVFKETGYYEWAYSYVNRVNLTHSSLNVSEGCTDVFAFYVDTEAPEIKVSFDNNACTNDTFFATGRTATIEITEHNFDENATKVYVNGEERTVMWNRLGRTNKYIATYSFEADGYYALSLQAKDKAGNESEDVTVDGATKAPWEFTIDQTEPTNLRIAYAETANREVNLEDKDYAFYQREFISVHIEATDAGSAIDKMVYTYGTVTETVTEPQLDDTTGVYYWNFEIPAQFCGTVSYIAYNKAGMSSEFADTTIRVVDTIPPRVNVIYNPNEEDGYYNKVRKAEIQIEEANFFKEDLDDGLLVITVGKTDENGAVVTENIKPEFRLEDGVHKAEYLFEDDAEYTFDIKYTDRAENAYDEYEEERFVIDKLAPVIEINKADGAYIAEDREVTISVTEKNFDAKDFVFNVEATDIEGRTIDLSNQGYAERLKDEANWSSSAGQKWQAHLTFDIEGQYKIKANYVDLAGNPAEEKIDTFCIDKNPPENLSLQYDPEFSEEVLKELFFGFSQGNQSDEGATVKVKITAADNYAGVSHFVYSYKVEEGASAVNRGMENISIEAKTEGGAKTASASFEIPAQFRGHLTVTAYDKSGNYSTLDEKKILVVDNIKPEIEVSYDNNTAINEVYYNGDRNATITITEANFFGTSEWDKADLTDGNLSVIVTAVDNAGNSNTTSLEPDFVKETEGDIYKAKIPFTGDGDYTLKVSYKDRSGNEGVSEVDDSFTIDKSAPEISVSFDNNDCRNSEYFNAERKAIITVTEHNFDADLVDISVKKWSEQDEAYIDFAVDRTNWTHNGDIHEIILMFNEEGHYTFEIACKDMAGIDNQAVDYGTSLAPNKFTIDTSAPDAEKMQMLIGDVSVKGSEETFAFDTFYKDAVNIRLSADCDISGVSSLMYQKVSRLTDYAEDSNWVEYDEEKGITISPSDKCIVFFKAEDKAGNSTIVRTSGIIVDNKEPSGERNAPEIDIIPAAPNGNGYYAGDVRVDLKVIDPKYLGEVKNDSGFYSGLKEITGKIYTTDTSAVETFELFRAASNSVGADEDGLVPSWSGNIVIDSEKFNSNNVIVEIVATDNTGNSRITSTKAGLIQIDKTAPLVDISYSNNSAVNEKIFNADRIATIVVTERNFRPEDLKIVLTNSDGTVPGLSAWSKTAGTGNLDDTRWTATLHYSEDGDYVFNAAYADVAGNACQNVRYVNSVAPNEFTIDKTIPVIAVRYDNNSARNGYYYNENRVAVIDITEHNFRPEDVTITMTASDDGKTISLPAVSNWSASGDRHTATIRYENDGKYTFDIAMNDMAGNAAADYVEDSFVVDKTMPVLSITGVVADSANSGAVIPVITYSDTNYDEQQVVLSLTGANRKSVVPDGSYADIHNGRVFTFKDFAYVKDVDDIYTLSVTITDKAGNVSSETLSFSVNRFGSNYVLDKEVEEMNGKYIQDPKDIVVKEVNANELTMIKITMYKNNETVVLEEGKDYSVKVEGGNGKWYEYTYTIFADIFAEDGIYRFAFYSEDGAGNVAENTLDTKNTEVSMGVDRTKPNIIMVNLESDKTYAVENLTVYMTVSDNLLLQSVKLYLDDFNKEYKVWEGKELEDIIAGNGEFAFDISGGSRRAHNIKVVCCDAAGNERTEEISDFFVTTDMWVRYFNNKPLFFGSIGGFVLLVGLVVFLIVFRRKRDEM